MMMFRVLAGVLLAGGLAAGPAVLTAQIPDPGQRLIRERAKERVREAGKELREAARDVDAGTGSGDDSETTGSARSGGETTSGTFALISDEESGVTAADSSTSETKWTARDTNK